MRWPEHGFDKAIRTIYVKAKTGHIQKNSKYRLCCNKDETVNHNGECSKLAQKEYKSKYDRVWEVIYWKVCKNLKFVHTTEWHMHNQKSFLENETHEILRELKRETNHLIATRRPDLVLIYKKKEFVTEWILPFQWTTKWKKMKANSCTERWKKCGIWKWLWYQS